MRGKGKKRGGKTRQHNKTERSEKRELMLKEQGQEYAQVLRILGNSRVEVLCFDGKTRLAHIRGKMRKRVWIKQDDIVLITLRDFQDDKSDVVLKYTEEEARQLKSMGEIPDNTKIGDATTGVLEESDDEDATFVFEEI